MNRIVSPTASRDLALLTVAAAALGGILLAGVVLAMGAAVATVVLGGAWQIPEPQQWATLAGGALATPTDPARTWPAPWGPTVTGHARLYWVITGLLGLFTVGLVSAVGIVGWRRYGPLPSGHATRADLHRTLSPAAIRRTAAWTRPTLTAHQRRHAPLTELGVPHHRGPHGRTLWTPLENPTGVLAPTQSGKTRQDLIHTTLAAPGALLCSTTKPDLLEFAALARSRRGGPVLVLDATGTVVWPVRLRWSPIHGCTTPDTARRRADVLVDAAAIGLSDITGNDKVFRGRAKTVLQAYLLAAAEHGLGVDALVRWAIHRDDEPIRLLLGTYPELARNLRNEQTMVAETADAVWMSVRRVLEPLLDPTLRDLCTPAPGQTFDLDTFLQARGSLFVIAGEHHHTHTAPLLTALVEEWITTAQHHALTHTHRRLDPPATGILDEVTHATPLPRLPEFIADSAGRGVLLHWAAQSLAKLEDTYTPAGARQLLDNTTCLTAFGGLKDKATLEWLSTLTSHHDRTRYQHHSDGLLGPGRSTLGTDTVPVYRPGDIRTLTHGRVLVFHRTLPVIRARTLDVRHRRDWPTLRADRDLIRNGTPPIRPDGYPEAQP